MRDVDLTRLVFLRSEALLTVGEAKLKDVHSSRQQTDNEASSTVDVWEPVMIDVEAVCSDEGVCDW